MGLRSLLSRQPAAESPVEPLAELAAIGRAEDPDDHPSSPPLETTSGAPFAPLTTVSDPAGVSPVAVGKKSGVTSVGKLRSRSGYVWVSQKSREAGSEAVRFAETNF